MQNPARTLPEPAWKQGPEDQQLDWREELQEVIDVASMCRNRKDISDRERLLLIQEVSAHASHAAQKLIYERTALLNGLSE